MPFRPSQLGRGALLAALLGVLPQAARAQQPSADAGGELAFLELDAALEQMTSVASSRARSVREAPGSVTVITRDDILDSGARDLTEVLQRIPGFGFVADTEGVLANSVRGLPGDGRTLVLLDGQVLNDGTYNAFPFGGRIPLELVDSIEVVRGPAFALYGETAELAVLHIHTVGAQPQQPASAQVWLGHARSLTASTQLSVGALASGEVPLVPGLRASVAASLGDNTPADRDYTSLEGDTFSVARFNRRRPLLLSAGAEWQGLSLRLVHEDLTTLSRDGFGPVLERAVHTDFRTTSFDARWALKLGERLTLTPRLSWRHQLPWRDADPASPFFYDKVTDRYGAHLTLQWDVTDAARVVVGAESWREHAALNQAELAGQGLQFPFGDSPTLDVGNLAGFTELSWDLPWVHAVAGARAEYHSVYGPVLVPRLALTRTWERLHLKLLASGAFRAPSVEMMGLNPDIVPEHARVLEAEAGYQLTHWLGLTATAFGTRVRDVIVYFVDEATGLEGYRNGARTGSRGVELTARLQLPWVRADVAYAYANTAGLNTVPDYTLPDEDGRLLGIAPHTLTAHASFRLTDALTLAPSLVLLGERVGYTAAGAADTGLEVLPPAALLHLNLRWQQAFGVRGLEAGVGVRNLLDVRYGLPQAYPGGHGPLPVPGRELVLRLGYTLPLE